MSEARTDRWLSLPISEIADFGSGDSISVAQLSERSSACPIPVFGGNGIAGYTSSPTVSRPTVILGRVGQKCGVVYQNSGPAWITDNALYVRRYKRPVDVQFLALALESAHLNDVRNRNDLPLITQSILKDVKIAWPESIEEQRHVAEFISDADKTITSLESMIVKKQAIRQGMMQQLLTGRTRLPGFSAQWGQQQLSDLLSYEQPWRYLVQTTKQLESGRVPVLTAGKTFVLGYTNETHGVYKAHPVIIFDDFTTASKYVDFDFKAKSSAMKILKARPGVDLRFVYERLQVIDFPLGDHKRYWISEYSKFEIEVPDEAEQRAIGMVSADLDRELRALQARLAKARDIRQGMMQQLLTGRTRLPVPEATL